MSLSLRFQCVQKDCLVVKQVVLLKIQDCSIPVDLLRVSEPRYQARYLSSHQALGKFNVKFLFLAHDDLVLFEFLLQGSRSYKRLILQSSSKSYKKTRITGVVVTFVHLRFCTKLLQFIHVWIEELYKATTIKKVVVESVTNRRFVQMRCLQQEQVQSGIEVETGIYYR